MDPTTSSTTPADTEVPQTPAPETVAPGSVPAAPVEGGSELFSGLANESDDDTTSTEPVKVETPPPAPPAEVVKPAEPPATVAISPPPPAQVATTPEVKAPPAPTDEERKAQYDKDRAAAVAQLIEQYAISEELTPRVITEPEKVLPQLLAQVHVKAVEHAIQYLTQNLPVMMQAYTTTETARKQAAEQFFTEWPELKDPKHGETVARVLSGYRQANPQAKPEEVIREGGVAALLALRLPIPERVLKQHNVNQPDATKPTGFTPVTTPGAARTVPTGGEKNLFAVIAQEDLQDG